MNRPFVPLPVPSPPPDEWNTLTVKDLAEPLPPIPWVCESLGLAPGAVSLFAGYGYSRKTMALQSLGLSVATGKPVWGVWRPRQGLFVHLDYEQGRRITQERYQRLARGMGLELGSLEESCMRACIMPRAYLDSPDIGDRLSKLVEGAAFVLVDSLRAAFPHADENSSEIRGHLDILSRVSERTGAAIAVIHHARKPSQQSAGTATHAIRGSSSLFDACQSVYVFEGEKGQPTTVHHQKDRVRGETLPTFGITSEDVPGDGGPRDGLRVVHLEGEQMVASAEARAEARKDADRDRGIRAIVKYFSSHAGRVPLGIKAIRSQVGIKGQVFDDAWSELVRDRRLMREGPKHEPSWVLLS